MIGDARRSEGGEDYVVLECRVVGDVWMYDNERSSHVDEIRRERGQDATLSLCYAGRVVRCSQGSSADAIRYPRGMEQNA